MTLNLQLPIQEQAMRPVITVVGVGGAGGNAVNNMISAQLEGVQFVVANTDAQALESTLADRNIQLGRNITQGLGAGATPDIGQAAAEEAAEEIAACVDGSHMVFITAGMGGGTGTGGAPVVARMARDQGMLTVGVVTKPFQFEGGKRMRIAEQGIEELQKYVDTLIVIPNQNLFRIANEKTTFADAFRMADEVLHSGVRGVTDLMVKPGLVNLDFADIRTIMQEMGKAMMGTGEASGEKRAVEAAEAAISNPLLDDISLRGARASLINITGGADMTLYEVDEAANRIREEIDSDANIIFGSTFHESMQGMMRVSVVATGIDVEPEQEREQQNHGNASGRHNTFGKAAAPKAAPGKPGYYGHNAGGQFAGRVHSHKHPTSGHMASPSPEQARREGVRSEPPVKPRAGQGATGSPAPKTHASAGAAGRGSPGAGRNERQVSPASSGRDPEPEDPAREVASSAPSPHAPQPSARQFDASREAEPEDGSSSHGIFGRIADVGRSFQTREQAQSSPRAVQVNSRPDARQDETGSSARHATSSYPQDYDESQEEESYYDIPAFLRRQGN